ncbi:MAG: dTDP-4-amino-4,6-dideoxygalactose transaminase [Planctomycetes bacterium]|jgi:dTDP-4-amino-4,6-dideoxygalactose transaminase|nr:dTDP-4-amino-4,6-dideoxygalactose transaminase [Planctomycetota bacterium]
MSFRIPFNKPFVIGRELFYIAQAVESGHLSGDGSFGRRCGEFLARRFGVHRALLTPSCSGALDLAGALCGLDSGSEVVLPSFTFTSTANSVLRTGARPVFVDIREDTLNLDERLIPAALSPRTRAIWPVHYAGVACEMDEITALAAERGLMVVEDAAQGVGATYRGRALGSLGDLAAYSFHETKNVISGEGGALCINDPSLVQRAEILREKGTDRSRFFRGEVDRYTWHDAGYSEVPSEVVAAFLWGQLEHLEEITARRRALWERYHAAFADHEIRGALRRPIVPDHCGHNGHIYYLLLPSEPRRDALIESLRARGILAVFHYLPLHLSPLGRRLGGKDGDLPVTEALSARLVRLPLYHELTPVDQDEVIAAVHSAL